MKKVFLLAGVLAMTLASCSKDDIQEDITPCGCTVTQSGPGGTIPLDVSNSQSGYIGCGDRADQAEAKIAIGQQILLQYGEDAYADWLANVTVTFRDFYCD